MPPDALPAALELSRSLAGYGLMLPTFDPYRRGGWPLLEAAERAEELGFDSAWAGDHLQYHAPVLEPCAALSAVAARTRRLRLGFGVLLLALRSPVWAAKQLGTLEALAPGRVVLGVGAGGENPAEFEAAGVPVRERGRRLDEALEVVGRLLEGGPVDHPGPLLPVRSPGLEPVPGRRLPLAVGGRSEAAQARAARAGDAWLAVWLSPERVAQGRERIAALAAAAGRPAPQTLLMVFVHVGADRSRARAEVDALTRGQYGLPLERLERWALIGDAATVAEGLAAHRAAGVDGFVLHPASPDPVAQLEPLAAVRELLR
ncbi:MAG TPA: LLM class flavin-dependent oxidoreductase [Candidatus Dormibacteraeota bacterium]|jgi:alkanesulfonate monooxygenase SsuD/methylene tetrahydromethanopterin reductase-like flavin-dependent oxidoreductase (luciferase family)|nr:LLM class flavin-dependent oxidoreductase [Candidatus Dormibacteraeota bacterium]